MPSPAGRRDSYSLFTGIVVPFVAGVFGSFTTKRPPFPGQFHRARTHREKCIRVAIRKRSRFARL